MTTMVSAATQSSATLATAGSPPSGLSTEEQMLALIVYTQASQMAEAKTTIDLNAEQLNKLREQVREALEKAKEAEKDSGFWGGLAKIFGGDLASLATLVAAVAAVVMSGGTAAAILAVVATGVSIAAEHADELGIPAEVAVAIAIAASVAGLCAGNGKALFDVTEKTAKVAGQVRTYALGAAATLKAGGAACGGVAAGFEHTAKYAQAEAQRADGQQDLVSADMDEALDRFSQALDAQNAAVQQASSIQQQSAASNYAVLNNWGGAA